MDYPSPSSNTRFSKTMNPEQFNQVVEAILAGKYSWACVLILRFAGYNPLHYIPYRTYNRLIKENCQYGRRGGNETGSINGENQNRAAISNGVGSRKCLSEIADLAYLETVGEQNASIRGGSSYQLLESGASSFNLE
jgi:hypothetical protein